MAANARRKIQRGTKRHSGPSLKPNNQRIALFRFRSILSASSSRFFCFLLLSRLRSGDRRSFRATACRRPREPSHEASGPPADQSGKTSELDGQFAQNPANFGPAKTGRLFKAFSERGG